MVGTVNRLHSPEKVGGRIYPWQDDARCAETDPDLFFPEAGETRKSKDARAMCATCPVIAQCAELGTRFDFGIFGGTTGPQRARARQDAAR